MQKDVDQAGDSEYASLLKARLSWCSAPLSAEVSLAFQVKPNLVASRSLLSSLEV